MSRPAMCFEIMLLSGLLCACAGQLGEEAASGDAGHAAPGSQGAMVGDGGSFLGESGTGSAAESGALGPATAVDSGASDAVVADAASNAMASLCEAPPLFAVSHHPTTISIAGRCWDGGLMPKPGDHVSQGSCNSSIYLQFKPVLQRDDCSFLLRSATNPALCVDAGSSAGSVVHAPCDASVASQRWLLTQQGDGLYQVTPRSGGCIALPAQGATEDLVKTGSCSAADQAAVYTLSGLASSVVPPAIAAGPLGSGSTSVPASSSYGFDLANHPPVAEADLTWSNGTLGFYRPGGYFRYDLQLASDGAYLLSIPAAAWLEGTYVNVVIDGQPALRVPLQRTSDLDVFATSVLQLDLHAGPHSLELRAPETSAPSAGAPFKIGNVILTALGEHLDQLGAATQVASGAVTMLDLRRISDVYRFTLTTIGGTRAWAMPHNLAFLDYRVQVDKPGSYDLVVTYQSDAGSDAIDVLYDTEVLRAYGPAEVHGSLDLPAGMPASMFVDSKPCRLELPQGPTTLRLVARGKPSLGVQGYAISALRLSPAP